MSSADDTPQPGDPFDDLLQRAARLTPVPVEQSAGLTVGAELCDGRFKVLRRIGKGGMGVVHEAEDRRRGKRVALKTLSRLDAAGIARLKSEFRSLSDVIHPNLVRLYDLHADNGLWLFAMELISGEPFGAWVRPGGELDRMRFDHAVGQLVAGVQAIHAAGKLHLDLKPDNVLVEGDGRVVVVDYGLVSDSDAFAGEAGQTAAGEVIRGTPAYMAPEQTVGERATAASDVYQLGVMIFEGLTGRLPITGEARAIMKHKRERRAPSLAALAQDASPQLAELCQRLLESDPAKRPTVEQLAAVFPLSSSEPSPWSPRRAALGATLVGRDDELSVLRRAYASAEAGTATVVAVVAESGLGKTALVQHFLSELRGQGTAVVLSGRCYERENVPYKGFDRLVDALTRYLRALPEIQAAALLPRDAHALVRVFPVMARVASIADAPARPVADEWQLRRRAWDALTELLARIRDRQPVVLHIDDVQWIDEDSMSLLEHLLYHPQAAPVLLLLGCNGSQGLGALELGAGTEVRQLQLTSLSQEAACSMAAQLLVSRPDAAVLSVAVAREAEGNPFLISALCQSLLHGHGEQAAPKVSLDDAIVARTRHLNGTSTVLLELIAASGRPVPLQVVVDAADACDDPHGELDLLSTLQLVHRGQDGTVECHHDRIRTAIETRLSDPQRRALHTRLADAWAAADTPDPEVLFEHHQSAGNLREAGRYAVEAAEKVASGLAFDRAAGFYRRAIELVTAEELDSLALHRRLGAVLSLGGHWGEAGAAFAQAADRVAAGPQRADLTQHAARHLLGSGNSREGLPMLRRGLGALGIAWPRSELSALLRALMGLVWLRVRGARYRLADADVPPRLDELSLSPTSGDVSGTPERSAEMMRVEGLLDGAGLLPAYDFARGTYYVTTFIRRALSWGERSRVAVALAMLSTIMSTSRLTRGFAMRLASEAEGLARSGVQPELAVAAFGFVGFTRMVDGQLEQARALGAEGAALVAGSSRAFTYQRWAAQGLQGCALMLLGRVGEAARLSDEIGREARELGDEMARVGGEAVIARLLHDDVEGAQQLLAHKQSVLGSVGDRGVLHQIVVIERICFELYCGRGHGALAMIPSQAMVVVTPFNASALAANCALQALGRGHAVGAEGRRMLGVVRGARRSLVRARGKLNAGIIPQLDAGLALQRGDLDAAVAFLQRAADCYDAAGMQLHAHMMRWRRGRLQGEGPGAAQVARAQAFMSEHGVVNPEAWAELMAPGLAPPAA